MTGSGDELEQEFQCQFGCLRVLPAGAPRRGKVEVHSRWLSESMSWEPRIGILMTD